MAVSVRRRGAGITRHSLPFAAVTVALVVAVVLLPTALRPPPDVSNASGALNPNAPPQDNTQFLEASQQASGGGAGSGEGGGASTTTSLVGNPTASLSYCFGNPPRQIPSVYSGPCVGAWHGNNGGKTWKNVFPNEIRVAVQGANGPGDGRLKEVSENDGTESGDKKTWQALEEYFNRHFQFYNRKVKFYGMPGPASTSDADINASATNAAETYQAFVIANTVVDVCKAFSRKQLISMCDNVSQADNAAFAPYLFEPYMSLNQGVDFLAEFACKSLTGNAHFGGPDVSSKPRKLAYLGYYSPKGGIPGEEFQKAYKNECGGTALQATMSSDTDVQGASAAVARFKSEGVTSILFYNQGVNVLAAMQAADGLAYNPEWVMMGAFAVDTNLIGTALPQNQARHLFGMSSSEEIAQRPERTECAQAVREIDPGLSASTGLCKQWWVELVLTMDGLQGAGPNLTPANYEKAMHALGHRFNSTPWALGGGYGPGDHGYTDDVGLVWWNAAAPNVQDGTQGAYVWTHGAKRFQRGQLPKGDAEFFQSGIAEPPER
jgi:hypothetical protein